MHKYVPKLEQERTVEDIPSGDKYVHRVLLGGDQPTQKVEE